MEDDSLAPTLVARLAEDLDLAQTLVKRPRGTIEPARHATSGGVAAVEALRRMAGSLDAKISLERTIGEGGMGVVRLATQATLGRHVAVKTLKQHDGQDDVDATLRILREAWVTGALEHPNIVPVYDVGVDAQGAPVIVMKRVEGRSWSDVIGDADELARLIGAADPLEANVRILVAVCNAVHFAHSRGILHRDIKPENVMIGSFGEVYVLDWGIAVSLHDDPSGRLPLAAHATELAGTPSYMAPEMVLGDPTALSPRTDVYLLGAVFYELFAGEPPHVGDSLEALISSIALSRPAFSGRFPAEARRICEQAMSRDPGARYESVEAFKAAIEGYLQHRGSRKLAWDAKQSLSALLQTLADEPSEERTLAVFNLLGECRFGYRAALSAWAGNDAARRGLDRALLGVIDHELAEGDPNAAATLLREVSEPSPEVTARVEAAVRARAEEEERLRRLGQDLDATVGTRTRTLISGVFGLLWIATPLVLWWRSAGGSELNHALTIGGSAVFLGIGVAFRLWARESLTKTLLNRRLSSTLGIHLGLQMVLGIGAWLAGMTPVTSVTLHIFAWTLTKAIMAVWVETWFAACAAWSALTFLAVSHEPSWLYPLMAIDNLVLTLTLVLVWAPRQDIELVKKRRQEIRHRVRRMFLEAGRREAVSEEEGP